MVENIDQLAVWKVQDTEWNRVLWLQGFVQMVKERVVRMAENGNGAKAWTEYFRFLTPVFLLCLNVLAGVLVSNQNDMKGQLTLLDDKMFKHFTNDEMHSPRTMTVLKPEFEIYQKMRDKQMDEMNDVLKEIKACLESFRKETRGR